MIGAAVAVAVAALAGTPPTAPAGPAESVPEVVVAANAGSRILELTRRMVDELGPRSPGSPGHEASQAWLRRQLWRRGWTPERFRPRLGPETEVACRRVPGARTVLFLSHLDTVPGVVGANDDAAGVATLLVAAEDLRETPRTVCLGFTDAEESGMVGSRILAREWAMASPAVRRLLGDLDQVMSLDVVGRGVLTHNGLGPEWGAERLRALLAAAPADVPWAYRAVSYGWPERERSDHAPFAEAGIPSSHLMARGESGVYLAYHTTRDTVDQLQVPALQAAYETVLRVAAMPPLPEDGEDAAFVVPDTQIVVPGFVTWVAVILLGALAAPAVVVRHRLRWELRGLPYALGTPAAAGVAATVACLLVSLGRPLDMALAEPAMVAGWAAWAAVAFALPRPNVHAPVALRYAAIVAVGMTLVMLVLGAPHVALPCALTAGALGTVALTRESRAWVAIPVLSICLVVCLLIPTYLLRPAAVRELAFHGMVPASPWVWGLGWTVLALPACALLGARYVSRRMSAQLAVAFAVVSAVFIGLSWRLEPFRAPLLEHDAVRPVPWYGASVEEPVQE